MSVNKKYKIHEAIEHQGLEALTDVPVQKAIDIQNKV